jgi:hypothetical protein
MRFVGLRAGFALAGLFFLMGGSPSLRSQTVKRSPCGADTAHPGWRVYTNREFRFCLQYPPKYHEVPAPPPDQFSNTRRFLGSLVLNSLPLGTYGGAVDNKASIAFAYIPKHFSMSQMQACCAPTGADEPPAPVRLGRHVFYFYGAGGGGVDYPDEYLMEMNGKILLISFGGPWKESKSPIEETKRLEPKILSTLQTY